ncbi:hypothetical protein ABE488_09095 [Luteimonas sp. TWI662]|uniref:hypothetical protein n=1 Tax=Luteimonas sp. TWI662 TaxID=3136789 RepID=UPI0032087704
MTHERQYREPRAAAIFRYTTDAVRNSRHTDASFASAVAETYMAQVAPEERTTQFHVGTDADSIAKAEKANAKLIERFRNGTVKLPADLEEAWVESLPEPWRLDCARALARRYGFIGARAPDTGIAGQLLCTARVAIEFGQALQAIAEINSDGVVDAQDLPRIRRALAEYRALGAEVVTQKATLQAELDRLEAEIRRGPLGVVA